MSSGKSVTRFPVRIAADYPLLMLRRLSADLMSHDLISSEFDNQIQGLKTLSDYETLMSGRRPPQSITGWIGKSCDKVAAEYQCAMYLKKYMLESNRNARRETALKKFRVAEQRCHWFNGIGYRKLLPVTSSADEQVCEDLSYAQEFIKQVIGYHLPEQHVLTEGSRHGPGSTSTLKHADASRYFKYRKWPYTCTSLGVEDCISLILSDPRWRGVLEDELRTELDVPKWVPFFTHALIMDKVIHLDDSNRICLVPKDANTDRTIAAEPTLNVMLQLGVDAYIRRRLRRWGIDLNTVSRNTRLASRGSRGSPLVTVDLSSASDTISLRVVQMLLPPEWYRYLVRLRAPYGKLPDGTVTRYGKISSMGNGYTFVLETLIFASVIIGVCHRFYHGRVPYDLIAVYGDDLVYPAAVHNEVAAVLTLLGFTINSEKTFVEGPFRESCGTDWFEGNNIRPVFLRRQATTLADLFNDRNQLYRWFDLRVGINPDETSAIKEFDSWIPPHCADLVGPISDDDFQSYRHALKGRYQCGRCYTIRCLTTVQHTYRQHSLQWSKLMASLHGEQENLNPWDPNPACGGVFSIPTTSELKIRSRDVFITSLEYRDKLD